MNAIWIDYCFRLIRWSVSIADALLPHPDAITLAPFPRAARTDSGSIQAPLHRFRQVREDNDGKDIQVLLFATASSSGSAGHHAGLSGAGLNSHLGRTATSGGSAPGPQDRQDKLRRG